LNGKIVTKITNFEVVKKSIPAGTLVGNLFLAEKVAMLQENRIKEDVSTTLKKIRFIKNKLKMDESPLLKDNVSLRGKVIGLFLKNFKALSVDSTDIGSCTLEEYDIQLVPGAQPFKNRMIRLNPHQKLWLNASYEVNWMTLTAVRSLAGQMHIALGYQNWILSRQLREVWLDRRI
jgi:hypothetical protein